MQSPAAAPNTPERIDELAARIERLQVEPSQQAVPSCAPSTPPDGRRSSRRLWPSPITPLQGSTGAAASDTAADRFTGHSNGAAAGLVSKRMRSTADVEAAQSMAQRNADGGAEEPIPMQCSPSRPEWAGNYIPAMPFSRDGREQPGNEPAAPAATQEYLCYFLHRLLDFRAPELVSLASMAGIRLQLVPPDLRPDVNPLWRCRLPSDDAVRRLAQRSMLVKGFFEVYAEGATMDELVKAARALPPEVLAPHRRATWKVLVADLRFMVGALRTNDCDLMHVYTVSSW